MRTRVPAGDVNSPSVGCGHKPGLFLFQKEQRRGHTPGAVPSPEARVRASGRVAYV